MGFVAVNAQEGQGQGQRGGQMREQMKIRLKDELKFTEVQIDSVMSIQMALQQKMRQVRMDANATEDQKSAQLKTLGEERKTRLKSVLSDDEITKLDAYYETMRRNRGNGGNRPQVTPPQQ